MQSALPPLADRIMAACTNPAKLVQSHPDPAERRKIGAALKDRLRNSRRFYVDEEVTRAATRLGVQHPEILMQMLRRARLPFGRVWVEWDNRAQAEESGIVDETAPDRFGVLVERLDEQEPLYRMTPVGLITGETRGAGQAVGVSPISVVYHLDHPVAGLPLTADQRQIAEIADLPEDYVRKTLIGSAYVGQVSDRNDQEEVQHRIALCDTLAAHATNVLTPFMAPLIRRTLAGDGRINRDVLQRIMRTEVIENSGTWRFVISLFALINARDYVESEQTYRAGKSRMVGGNIVPFLDHWLVSLKLPRKIVEARIIRQMTEAIPRRRHEVIGHWKHSRKHGDPNCEHAYVSETPTRERCAICGAARWWVNEFERGDASIGYIIKDRLVESRKRIEKEADIPTTLEELDFAELSGMARTALGSIPRSRSEALEDVGMALSELGIDEAQAIALHRRGKLQAHIQHLNDAAKQRAMFDPSAPRKKD